MRYALSRSSKGENNSEKRLLEENNIIQIKESSSMEIGSEVKTAARIGSIIRLNNSMLKASAVFVAGTIGILIGAEPFIHSQGFFS